MQDAGSQPAETRPSRGYLTQPVDATRPLQAAHDLVLRTGSWRAAAAEAGIGLADLCAAACGLSPTAERAVSATNPGHPVMTRWRRWARNALDTAAMAAAFPLVLGYSGAKHRRVWQIPAAQSLPVALIAGFFAAGAVAKGGLSDLRLGTEPFWMWRVGAGMTIAIAGLYASGVASRFAVESRGWARAALAALAVAVAASATTPFSNAVLDVTAENRDTRAAFAESARRHAEIASRGRSDPGYNVLPDQRATQRDLLRATRQPVPPYLDSDEAYYAHLRTCFRGGRPSPECIPQVESRAGEAVSGSRIVTVLWERQWR